MSSTVEASVFMGKNYSDNLHPIKIQGNFHFEADVRHIWKVDGGTIRWDFGCVSNQVGKFSIEKYLWSMVMKKSSVSRMQRFMYFQILCYVLERWIRTQHQILFGKKSWVGSKIHHNTELWTQLTENRWNSSGIFSQDSPHCGSATKSNKSESSWTKWATQVNSKDELSSCRCSMTSYGELKDNEQECIANATLVSVFAKRFPAGRWSFLGPGSKKKWYSTHGSRPQGEWDRVAELMMIKFGESGHPVFRATSPLSRGTLKSKGCGKLSIHFCAEEGTVDWNCFSHDYFCSSASIYGTVSDLCHECKSYHVRTGRPVLVGQSDPLFVPTSSLMKTPTLSTDDPAQEAIAKVPRTSGKAITTKSCD